MPAIRSGALSGWVNARLIFFAALDTDIKLPNLRAFRVPERGREYPYTLYDLIVPKAMHADPYILEVL